MIHQFLNHLIGKIKNTLLILKIQNLKDMMIFKKKFLTLMPLNLKIGTMNSMANGKPQEFQILNTRENGEPDKLKILNTKVNGFTHKLIILNILLTIVSMHMKTLELLVLKFGKLKPDLFLTIFWLLTALKLPNKIEPNF